MVKITERRQAAFAAASSGKLKLTEEEKARWAPMLHETWNAIAPDADAMCTGRGRVAQIIEFCLDANRMQTFTEITPEEEGVLCGLWVKARCRTDTVVMRWLRQTLNY